MGGGFGSGLRPAYHLYLAVLASQTLERSVRVSLTRDQMFTFSYRPETIQTVSLGAETSGKLTAIKHHAVAGTSHFEDHQEVVVNWSGLLYDCKNAKLTYELAKIDTYTPADMRAPGAVLGVFAVESAMDELAYETGVDPVALRLLNYAETDENEGKEFTSKALKACFRDGCRAFRLVEAHARAALDARGPRVGRVGHGDRRLGGTGHGYAGPRQPCACRWYAGGGKRHQSDIGTGTYTVMAHDGRRHVRSSNRKSAREARRLDPADGAGRGRLVGGSLDLLCDQARLRRLKERLAQASRRRWRAVPLE